uniref:Uncharacterized protein n=1 Tax=Sciurus vulgaris TaxID=55149 RepID=A0A8D2JMU0_SCIVU
MYLYINSQMLHCTIFQNSWGKMGSHYVAQVSPKLLGSSDPPASASQVAGTAAVLLWVYLRLSLALCYLTFTMDLW